MYRATRAWASVSPVAQITLTLVKTPAFSSLKSSQGVPPLRTADCGNLIFLTRVSGRNTARFVLVAYFNGILIEITLNV